MKQPKPAPAPRPNPAYRVNFFRPQPGFMRREVLYIWFALAGWALATFGFQFLLYFGQEDARGSGALTSLTLLDFPFHYWFSGQFLIAWFILLCFVFNVVVDRLTDRYRKRK